MKNFLRGELPGKNKIGAAIDKCLNIHFPKAILASWSGTAGCGLAFAAAASLLFVSQAFAASQIQTKFVPQVEHRAGIRCVAFSPDGKIMVSGGRDGTVKLWDTKNRRLIRTFVHEFASYQISSVAFSSDGSKLLFSGDTFLSLWDVEKGDLLWDGRTGGDEQFTSAAFFPDGRKFASAHKDGSVRLWGTETPQALRTFKSHTGSATAVAVSPDGRSLASGGSDGYVKLWDADTGQELKSRFENLGGINSIAFSPDGNRLVSSSDRKTIVVTDVQTGRLLRSVAGHADAVNSAGFSPDGKVIVSASRDGTIKLWDVNSGRALRTVRTKAGNVQSVVFSPEGRRILWGSDASSISLWDFDSGEQQLGVVGGVLQEMFSVAFSPNGLQFASGSARGAVSFWEASSGKESYAGKNEAEGPILSLAYSPDGRSIAFGAIDSSMNVLDTVDGEKLPTFTSSAADAAASVAFSPDGSKIVSGGIDKVVKLWDGKTGKLIRTLGSHDQAAVSVKFSPDGKSVASGDAGSSIKIWNLADGREIASLRDDENLGVGQVAYLADGRQLASLGSRGITIWDVGSRRKIKGLRTEEKGFPTSLVILPQSSRIVTGNVDNTLKIWDSTSGTMLRTLEGHTGFVTSVAISPDAKRLLSGSSDATVKIWDVQSGELLGTAISFDDFEWIFVSPEGFFEASPNGAKRLNVVRGSVVSSIDQFYDVLHRPDLVQQKLAGDPQGLVKAAAAKLDLNKVASGGGSPSVKITAAPISASDAQVVIEATVRDEGGGIGRIEWRNNKKALEIEAAGGTASVEKGKTVVVRKTVPLVVGENIIEVKAYNGQNLIESESVQVTVTRGKQPQAKITRPQLYVLAVGVNDYWDSKLHLNFAVPDAISMAEGLQQAGNKLYERVNITTVLNVDVSAANLDRIFVDLKGKVQAEDVFVFFLSGHGKTEGGKFYYIPQDFRYNGTQSIVQNAISHDKLKGWLGQILAQKSVLLFDACESGALIQGQIAMRGLEDKTALDHLVRATGATVLTATTDDKPAAEGYYGHGVFTYALLSAFANADANGDGFIDVQELASYVFAKVPALTDAAWGIKQSPQFNVVGSIYPLVAKTSLLPAAVASPAAAIPAVSTHVVIAASTVRQSASATSGAIIDLKPGTQVRLMEISGAWILVARDGKKLGYIDAKSVAGLQ
jgi:WD40 repeat protein